MGIHASSPDPLPKPADWKVKEAAKMQRALVKMREAARQRKAALINRVDKLEKETAQYKDEEQRSQELKMQMAIVGQKIKRVEMLNKGAMDKTLEEQKKDIRQIKEKHVSAVQQEIDAVQK